ncbi:MAG: response regulator transcription factor [Actinomycetota bacterium]|nr:response regulator transcription factor [Actinomycetota bacterium]
MEQEGSGPIRTRVLLCDDTRDVILLLGAEFDLHSDLEVIAEAANGRDAIALAQRLQPDVVVLDLTMPEMDGIEALPRIRRAAPETKVVVLSSHDATLVAPQVEELGAALYIEKGASACAIAKAVRDIARAS